MVSQNFPQFHKDTATELTSKKDRVRHLIAGGHWLTDGEYKESILRSIISCKLPFSVAACNGFACLNHSSNNNDTDQSSGQLDIVLRDREIAPLLEIGDTVFVIPQAIKGIIEVKTNLPGNKLGIRHVIQKLSANVKFIRENGGSNCLAGLFIYDENTSSETPHNLLKTLQFVCEGDINRVINYVSYGKRWFVRFWSVSEREAGVPYSSDTQAWHLYDLHNLAQAYFINNFVFSLSPSINSQFQSAYFPLVGGKSSYRKSYIKLNNSAIRSFS
jgi:hypothetical protein